MADPTYILSYEHCGAVLWKTRTVEAVLQRQIERLERHPSFRTGWDHEAFTYDHLAEHEPALLARMKEALARFEGRLGVGSCTYGQPLSVFIGEESNVRQLTMALQTVERRLGRKVSVYLMSEHAFHAQLPQLLAGCGFHGAVLRTHFMMYGFNPELDAPSAWWIGMDGSRIRCLPTYRGQLHLPLFTFTIPGPTTTLDNRILTDSPSEHSRAKLDEFRARFGDRIRPLVATRADDPRSHDALVAELDGREEYRWLLAEQLFGALPEPRAELKTGANDFRVRMPWGYCGNWIWNRTRAAEVLVLTAERLEAVSSAWNGADRQAELERAWKALLVAQHHDIQVCGLEEEAARRLDEARDTAQRIIAETMSAAARRIGPRSGGGELLFNPLPWERRELISPPEGEGRTGWRVVSVPALGFASVPGPGPADEPVPFEWREQHADREELWFHRRSSSDGRVFERCGEEVSLLRTPHYEVYLARSGGLRLLAPPKTSGTLAALVNGMDCESLGRIAEVKLGTGRALLVETGSVGGLPYRMEWRFYAHTRRIDWRAEIEFNGQLVGRPKTAVYDPATLETLRQVRSDPQVVTGFDDHEHKLRLRFYPYLHPGAFGVRDLPFHTAETSEACVQGLYWTAVSDGRAGVALFNRGLMGSVRESEGAFSSVLAFSLPYVWGSRMLKGKREYELGVLPFAGPWQEAGLLREALEYNFPCVRGRTAEMENPLGETWTPYRQRGEEHLVLSALYRRGKNVFARFYDASGRGGRLGLEWLGRRQSLVEVDLREREAPDGPGRSAELVFRPWQIRTVRLDAPGPP